MTGIATWTAIIPSPLTTFTKCQDLYETNDLTKTKIRDRLFLTFYGKCFTLGSFLFCCWHALEIIDRDGTWEHQRRHLGRCWAWEPRAADQGKLCLERHHYFWEELI